MRTPVRVGAVEYLNARPLVCDLPEICPELDLVYDVPSALAHSLAARELDVALGPVAAALAEAKRRGVARTGPIAFAEARRLGLDAGFCRRYLAHIIRFDLGERELAGLRRYYELACGLGLAAPGVDIEFYDRSRLAESR